MNNKSSRLLKHSKGFTLIELLVVVLIIGILAAIAVPQYFKVVEKGKFAESMQFLGGLKGAQERYLAKNGAYSTSTGAFDVSLGVLTKFATPTLTATNTPSWSAAFVRSTPCPAVYGCYTVTYDSLAATPLTCSSSDCTADLLP